MTNSAFRKNKNLEVEITKTCSVCEEVLPIEDFGLRIGKEYSYKDTDGDNQGQRRNECKKCKLEQNRVIRELRKEHPLPSNYTCPGCLKNEKEIRGITNKYKKNGVFCLNHNHETGAFEGWYCQDCNITLGRNMSPSTLERLAEQQKNFGYE